MRCQGSSEGGRPMPHVVFLITLVIGLLGVDTFGYHNRYSNAAWAEAKYTGQKFQFGVERWLRNSLRF